MIDLINFLQTTGRYRFVDCVGNCIFKSKIYLSDKKIIQRMIKRNNDCSYKVLKEEIMRNQYLILLCVLVFVACKRDTINNIQVIGSHNSYKIPIEPSLWQYVYSIDSIRARSLQYGHISIVDQLKLGLRSFEIDVFYDPLGGHYANPEGLNIVRELGEKPKDFDSENKLSQPGLKVFHIQDVDFRSYHLLFKEQLQVIEKWSLNNNGHMPIIILINAKDENIENLRKTLAFSAQALASIDKEIRSVFSDEQLITPDLVRGDFESLEQAVLERGWPDLESAKGKFLFVLDESATKTNRYLKTFPSLKKACLFVNKPEENPEAAFMVINDPVKDFEKIKQLVQKGYMVRTRADAGTIEARNIDYTRFEKAQRSGAQVISTDYYIESELFDSSFKVCFEQDKYERMKTE